MHADFVSMVNYVYGKGMSINCYVYNTAKPIIDMLAPL